MELELLWGRQGGYRITMAGGKVEIGLQWREARWKYDHKGGSQGENRITKRGVKVEIGLLRREARWK